MKFACSFRTHLNVISRNGLFFNSPFKWYVFAVEIHSRVTFHCVIVQIHNFGSFSPSVDRRYIFIHFPCNGYHGSDMLHEWERKKCDVAYLSQILNYYYCYFYSRHCALQFFSLNFYYPFENESKCNICIGGTSLFIVRTCPRIGVLIC